MALKGLYDSKLLRIHILGEPAEGEFKRPFKTTSLFGKPTLQYKDRRRNVERITGATGNPETDKAAIDEAEKRIGAKKED